MASQVAAANGSVFSSEVPDLLIEHYKHLRSSAISLEVIKERGYRSVLGAKQLADYGFSKAQQRRPGILIPLHGVDGTVVGHQYRPDRPRHGQKDRPIKYENPAGSSVRLDVPLRCYAHLGNPAVPLWFTEGAKKVDALATAGACAVGLTGVWGFKGRNPLGGTTILADFDYISFQARVVYLAFDSDSSSNPSVGLALLRLTEHLKRKGAQARVIIIPPGSDGTKVGADDYLADNHTLDDLIGCEKVEVGPSTLRKRSTDTYCIEEGRICWIRHDRDGDTSIPLCNFNAQVDEDILKDNGQEINRFFRVRATLPTGTILPTCEVPAAAFNNLNWVLGEWGMPAIIAAGANTKDRLREAIQLQSSTAKSRTIYTHTGWREVNKEPVFLTSAGGLGGANISVEMDAQLERYQIPQPLIDAAIAFQGSFAFLETADHRITLPLLAAMYLAPLSSFIEPAFTIWYVGPSGAFKSVITALALNHFGAFDHLHLPASWRDTANQLEKLLFLGKDVPIVIDDWAPGQDASKARELEAKAEHIVRAQGNRQGKGRMRADTSSRRNYAPRGLLITSGEQLPSGHSHTARIFTVEIDRGDVDVKALTKAQHETHLYRAAMYYYILWLRQRWEDLRKTVRTQWEEWREKGRAEGVHPRLPEAVASLYTGLSMGLLCAVDQKAIDQPRANEIAAEGWKLFTWLATEQGQRIQEERPAIRYINRLKDGLNIGTALLGDRSDDAIRIVGHNQTLIGWRDRSNGHIILDPAAAYQFVYQQCLKSGDPFTIKQESVQRDLIRMGYVECDPQGKSTQAVRIPGKRQIRALVVRKNILEEVDDGQQTEF